MDKSADNTQLTTVCLFLVTQGVTLHCNRQGGS